MQRIAIIGGGACGLWCAIALTRCKCSQEIVIFERQPLVGKKIAMSGNSRGNLSNANMQPTAYNHPEFVKDVFGCFSVDTLIKSFHDMGILLSQDDEGRIYPISESAQAVVVSMKRYLDGRGVKFQTNQEITDIRYQSGTFIINGEQFDTVVMATGSKAGLGPKVPQKTYPLINGVDPFRTTTFFPSLAAIGIKDDIKILSGLRVKAMMSLLLQASEHHARGELQFIDHALSGIAMFSLSSYYARSQVQGHEEHPLIIIDFMPTKSLPQLTQYLKQFIKSSDFGPHSLTGILPTKLSQWLVARYFSYQQKFDPHLLAQLIKHTAFEVDRLFVPENYQVLSGGIDISEVDSQTLMSKKFPSLYIGGEVLDVDGLCGGYNLHFAFASGETIATSISNKEKS